MQSLVRFCDDRTPRRPQRLRPQRPTHRGGLALQGDNQSPQSLSLSRSLSSVPVVCYRTEVVQSHSPRLPPESDNVSVPSLTRYSIANVGIKTASQFAKTHCSCYRWSSLVLKGQAAASPTILSPFDSLGLTACTVRCELPSRQKSWDDTSTKAE